MVECISTDLARKLAEVEGAELLALIECALANGNAVTCQLNCGNGGCIECVLADLCACSKGYGVELLAAVECAVIENNVVLGKRYVSNSGVVECKFSNVNYLIKVDVGKEGVLIERHSTDLYLIIRKGYLAEKRTACKCTNADLLKGRSVCKAYACYGLIGSECSVADLLNGCGNNEGSEICIGKHHNEASHILAVNDSVNNGVVLRCTCVEAHALNVIEDAYAVACDIGLCIKDEALDGRITERHIADNNVAVGKLEVTECSAVEECICCDLLTAALKGYGIELSTSAERLLTEIGDIILDNNSGQGGAVFKCRIGNGIAIDHDARNGSVLEHIGSKSGLFTKLNGLKVLTIHECTLTATAEIGQLDVLNSASCKCIVTDNADVGKIDSADILAVKAIASVECIVGNGLNLIEVDVFKNSAVVECVLCDLLTAFGKRYVAELGAVIECVLFNGLNSLGDNDLGYGLVSERRLLIVHIVVTVLVLLNLLLVIEIKV